MEPYDASISGAVENLREIGAVEGIHYRMSVDGEFITDFKLAVDNGPMIVTMLAGYDVVRMSPDQAFPVVNADGIELIGGQLTAAKMRRGSLPAEMVYLLVVP